MPTPHMPPPWVAHMQALADQADQDPRKTARDIVNGVVDDVIGPRPQTHRQEQ